MVSDVALWPAQHAMPLSPLTPCTAPHISMHDTTRARTHLHPQLFNMSLNKQDATTTAATTVVARTEGKPKSSSTTSLHGAHRLEPVGVFWDFGNCPVPANKSVFGVVAKMRKEFIGGKREAEFMCVCDITKERKEVTDDLHKAQVILMTYSAIFNDLINFPGDSRPRQCHRQECGR